MVILITAEMSIIMEISVTRKYEMKIEYFVVKLLPGTVSLHEATWSPFLMWHQWQEDGSQVSNHLQLKEDDSEEKKNQIQQLYKSSDRRPRALALVQLTFRRVQKTDIILDKIVSKNCSRERNKFWFHLAICNNLQKQKQHEELPN